MRGDFDEDEDPNFKPDSQDWEPVGKCQYSNCDGARFDWDSTDSHWGAWFCVKCGGMQVPPKP